MITDGIHQLPACIKYFKLKLVNSYESTGGKKGKDKEITDMKLSQTRVIVDQSLTADPGMNRFRWNMSHFGPWTNNRDFRFRGGPLVKPGIYTLKLTAGGSVPQQSFKLIVDPRVLNQGTTLDDIDAQVDFELKVVDLISEVRRFEKQVTDEQKKLSKNGDALSPEEKVRLELVNDILSQVKSADIIYPQPKLASQVSYLYNMVSRADQAPGREAENRFAELKASLADLQAAFKSPN